MPDNFLFVLKLFLSARLECMLERIELTIIFFLYEIHKVFIIFFRQFEIARVLFRNKLILLKIIYAKVAL